MKSHIISTVFLFCLILSGKTYAHYDYTGTKTDPFDKLFSIVFSPIVSIANHSWICEIIGTGRIIYACEPNERKFAPNVYMPHEHQIVPTEGFVDIEVDAFWRGDPGTNVLRVAIKKYEDQPPVSETPIVFFVTHYSFYNRLRWSKYRQFQEKSPPPPLLDMDFIRAHETPDGLFFPNDNFSWFHIHETNMNTVAYASNLVFTVDMKDTQTFYEILRDNFNDFPPPIGFYIYDDSKCSRPYFDSYAALANPRLYFTTNFISRTMWRDPKLAPYIKRSIWDTIKNYHGIDLEIEPTTIILVR